LPGEYRQRENENNATVALIATRRHIAVKRPRWLLIIVWMAIGTSAAYADSVVLIVGASSPIQQLSSVELRKVFMGFDVVSAGMSLRAARNRSDPRLEQIFFQNIVDLSELVYERQLLARKVQQASALPLEFLDDNRLLDAVARDPRIVSYTWATSAAKRSDVRILRLLWHD
jgi:hypothetical protein